MQLEQADPCDPPYKIMIIDQIENRKTYQNLHPGIWKGLQFLAGIDFATLSPGRNEIDGDRIFVLRQEYQTQSHEGGIWESHRQYIDIQYVYGGQEQIGYTPLEAVRVTAAYDPLEDCVLYEGHGQFFRLNPLHFMILFPQDVHMPGICIETPMPVQKIVVKVRI